jgi:hypothetical protein
MELSPSREAANCAATQEVPSILWNPKVHYRVHMSPLLVPILSQISPLHTIPFYLSKIHFNIIHPPTSWSTLLALSFWLSRQYPICIPLFPHSCDMPCPSHPSWLDNSNYTWAKTTSYEPPRYAVFSKLPPLHLSSVQIFSSALRSRTPSVYVPPLLSEIKFQTHTQSQAKFLYNYMESNITRMLIINGSCYVLKICNEFG